MRLAIRIGAAFAVAISLLQAGGATAEDWPQWRGANRDGGAASLVAPADWKAALKRVWSVEVGLGASTPAFVGDRIYVFARQGADEATLCLDAATGSEIWREQYSAAEVQGAARSHSGPRSSPAVAEGKVVNLGVGGILSCLDAATGEVVWRKDPYPNVVPAYYTSMSPLIVDGLAIAHLGGDDGGAIIAYDLESGDRRWTWEGDGPSYASPVFMNVDGTKQVVVETDKAIVGLAIAGGDPLWNVPFSHARMGTNSATPVVNGDTVFLAGAGRGTTAVRIEASGGKFTTEQLWLNEDLGTTFNTPVLRDGYLYGLSEGGNFYCMDAATGEETWVDSARHQRFGSIVAAGNAMLGLHSRAELYVFAANPVRYEELATLKVSDSDTYAHLVVSNNRIVIKDTDSLTLWSVE